MALEFPKTIGEIRKTFSTEGECFDYLAKSRWADGFVCPNCAGHEAWLKTRRHVFECRACHRQTSPTAGTIMHRSHVAITEWFWAAYLVATHTPGVSALQLQRQLGITSNDTTWYMLQRFRKGMVNEKRTPLSGLIEADETIIGGPAKGQRGRGSVNADHKALVIGAVEVLQCTERGKSKERAGRVRLEMIDHADQETIGAFVRRNIATHSTIRTDWWRGYSESALNGYRHRPKVQGAPEKAHQLAPHIHRVFSNLKTWLSGTHHGVEPKYLQGYLDEYVFRFNRRNTPMAAFQTLLGISASKQPVKLADIR